MFSCPETMVSGCAVGVNPLGTAVKLYRGTFGAAEHCSSVAKTDRHYEPREGVFLDEVDTSELEDTKRHPFNPAVRAIGECYATMRR